MQLDLDALLSPSVNNGLGQPVGEALDGWRAPPPPPRLALEGRFCRVEPLALARHAAGLFSAYAADAEGRMWTYLSYGPFAELAAFRDWLEAQARSSDPLFYCIVDAATDAPLGLASYLRIDAAAGAIEVGHLSFSPALQRTPAATEAMYLMMRQAFELGYRRYEWKCSAFNQPSRQAALRLGFTCEGLFRQARVSKGRNGDTAWFSILDREWPARRAALEAWLAPGNFDAEGRQRRSLASLRAPA
ncbi:GNAT family N-acetyltransferase [Xenophilus sp. AP218F]|nr:GNAT family N-acetyltransferase [Xenophilus sp. AP218F]